MKTWLDILRQKWTRTPEWMRSALIAAGLLLLLLPLTECAPAFWRATFVLPSAWLASWFLAADLTPTAQGWLLNALSAPVHVIGPCSGAGFFVLLVSLLGGQVLARTKPRLGRLTAALAFAYAAAVCVNTGRVVFTCYTDRWAARVLPANLGEMAHAAAGLLVLLVGMVAAWILFVKFNDIQRKEPA
jgi:exosortase/archaeosortase family protein